MTMPLSFLLHWRLKLMHAHSHTDVPCQLSYTAWGQGLRPLDLRLVIKGVPCRQAASQIAFMVKKLNGWKFTVLAERNRYQMLQMHRTEVTFLLAYMCCLDSPHQSSKWTRYNVHPSGPHFTLLSRQWNWDFQITEYWLWLLFRWPLTTVWLFWLTWRLINLPFTNLQTNRPAHQFLQPAVWKGQDHY